MRDTKVFSKDKKIFLQNKNIERIVTFQVDSMAKLQ